MEKLLTPDQLAEFLEIKKSTIYQWTHIGFIPHIKIGRSLRFKESDIQKWLDKRSVKGRKTFNQNVEDILK